MIFSNSGLLYIPESNDTIRSYTRWRQTDSAFFGGPKTLNYFSTWSMQIIL